MATYKRVDWSKHHDKIVELAKTKNMKKIAEEIGENHASVKSYMARSGIKACGGFILEEGDKELIIALWEEGLTAKEIAPKFEIGVNYCYGIIRQHKNSLKAA